MTDDPEPVLYDERIASSAETIGAEHLILSAERLVPTVTRVRGRIARITRRVVVERRQIEVDVAREELSIDYEPGDGTPMVGEAEPPFIVVLHEEEVIVTKRVRAVEEVAISTRRVTRSQRFEAAVRHEVLDVVESAATNVDSRMSPS